MTSRPESEAVPLREMVQRFIEEHADVIGPGNVETPLLSEWVMLTNWTDAEDGECILVFSSSANLLKTHRLGLLHEALWNWEDE